MTTTTNHTRVETYVNNAIRFLPRPPQGVLFQAKPLRVANTLMTCATAAAIFNELRFHEEDESVYRYINVHNPQCPLVFDRQIGRWISRPGREEQPIFGVNWAGANLLCSHIGARLPLAQEWECFASNNDPGKKYPWGAAAPTDLLANFGEHYGGVSPVGSFPPSELELYDLAGNLGEWCLDAYDASDLDARPLASIERVVKGGAWSKDSQYLEIARSRGKWGRLGTTTIGLRPVWED